MRRPNVLPYLLLLVILLAAVQAFAGDDRGAQQALRLWEQLDAGELKLRSKAALVGDHFGNALYERAPDEPLPIASITKLMTAMVILDRKLPLDEEIEITKADRDLVRLTGSRLKYGAVLTREQMLQLALMSSENRAASALARTESRGAHFRTDYGKRDDENWLIHTLVTSKNSEPYPKGTLDLDINLNKKVVRTLEEQDKRFEPKERVY